jgi:ribosomal protein S18 acetylase RimI-like enzyme
VERLVRAAGGRLDAGADATPGVDVDAGPVSRTGELLRLEPVPHEEMRDEAGRHYPAHLDVREVRHPKDWAGAWWAYWYNLPPQRWPLRVPAATYDLCRERRDLRRWREEVRRSVRLRRVTAGLPVGAWQWLAELPDGSPVGELRARRRGGYPSDYGAAEPAVVLDSVFVVSDCRRLGIARRLMAELTAEMDRSEIQVARVVVDHGEVRFYAACGFQVEATRPVKLTLTLPRPSAWPA